MKIIPKTEKDFEWVSWGPKDIDKAAKELVEKVKDDYEKIKAIPKKDRTFENTVYALETSGDVGYENAGIGFLQYVSTKKSVRESSNKVSVWKWEQLTVLGDDIDLYRAFKEYNPRKEKLTDEEKVMYKDTKISFERMGFDLPVEKRKELLKIKKKLLKLDSEFGKNIIDHEDFILCTKEELSGLPENYIANLSKDKKTKKYKVTLSYPELGPFMSYSDSDKKRKELSIKSSQKGGKRNIKLLQEMLILRKEKANLLGYKTYAHFATEKRMSKNPENIEKFLDSIIKKLKPEVFKEVKEVKKFANKEYGVKKLSFYDAGYYSVKLKKKLYDYDPNEVKKYFPLEKVMDYMFSLFGGLFGVSFKKSELTLWHKDVLVFDVFEKGKRISHIAFDLFPREGKFGHMACWNLIPGHVDGYRSNKYKAPFAVVVGNFPKGTKKNPSLLSVGEINTLFHEFGHMSHDLLTKATFESYAGTGTDFDFVETPSQLFENWVQDFDVLEEMSSHYKTGEKLPKDLKEKIKSADGFMKANEYYRTFILSKYDQMMHSSHFKKDVLQTYKILEKKYNPLASYEKSLFPASWGHMTGYEASYYTYMWSLVYAYDVFSRFKKEGIKNKKVGKDLRDKILSKGGSVDEMSQIKDFLGRKPNNKAFLEALGIK
jgi:thimet oligopeptidase